MQMHCVEWKMGYATMWSAKFSFKWICDHSYMKNMTNTSPRKPNASTMQNATMQKCIMMQKANVFVFFELKWDNKAKVWLYIPPESASTIRQHASKELR